MLWCSETTLYTGCIPRLHGSNTAVLLSFSSFIIRLFGIGGVGWIDRTYLSKLWFVILKSGTHSDVVSTRPLNVAIANISLPRTFADHITQDRRRLRDDFFFADDNDDESEQRLEVSNSFNAT